MERLTIEKALSELADEDQLFKELFKHGSLAIELYKPHEVDRQEPHSRDEIYVIATGVGYFIHDGVKNPVEPGEVLFVPAGAEHRFVEFSNDFSTWVFFYGPEGGENPNRDLPSKARVLYER